MREYVGSRARDRKPCLIIGQLSQGIPSRGFTGP